MTSYGRESLGRPPRGGGGSGRGVWGRGGEMVSGVFDRVHLFADGADIFDYKSDRAGDAASLQLATDKYTPQMATYRQALAKLTGLAESAIRCKLVFTHPCAVVEV